MQNSLGLRPSFRFLIAKIAISFATDIARNATFFIAALAGIHWTVAIYFHFFSLETRDIQGSTPLLARFGQLLGYRVDVECAFVDQTLRRTFFSPHSYQPSSILAPVHVQVKDSRKIKS